LGYSRYGGKLKGGAEKFAHGLKYLRFHYDTRDRGQPQEPIRLLCSFPTPQNDPRNLAHEYGARWWRWYQTPDLRAQFHPEKEGNPAIKCCATQQILQEVAYDYAACH
jgi:hypothetical protein